MDLSVEGVPGEGAALIQMTDVKIMPVDGVPKLFVYLKNDSSSSFEFALNARLYSSPSDRSFRRMKLVMPVREPFSDESRYIGRLFPKTALRMGAAIEESVPSGEYNVDVELIASGRIIQRRTFPVKVDSTSFPAQEIKTASVGNRLYLSPGQIELSQVRGGQRRQTLEVINSSDRAQTVELKPVDKDGNSLSDVVMQPNTFTLAAGSRRRISASLRSNPDGKADVTYAKLLVESKRDEDSGFKPVA